MTYLSGFQIVHRYAYVLLPREGEAAIVFPSEARYVGEHGTTWIDEQVFADRPGEQIAGSRRPRRAAGRRLRARLRDGAARLRRARGRSSSSTGTSSSTTRGRSRATRSWSRCATASASTTEGFDAFREAYAPGRSAAEVLAAAEQLFVGEGCGRLTMNMVLVGAEFAIARAETSSASSAFRRSRSRGRVVHWVEVSRALGMPNDEVARMNEAYEEYFEAAKGALRPGDTAHDAHRAVSKGFVDRG